VPAYLQQQVQHRNIHSELATYALCRAVGGAFMHEIGSIKVKPAAWKDFFFPEACDLSGS
jgi:hypothetical protein